ncbi:AhpC/TSA family protein [Sinomicrobium kalidii]|uniref:TlpA disulfide reductase family protein n=1 Tax=Sinomicrobium kalidii TaxID=2900738 RepID=UPI001E40CBAA|nr:TlpA disulfide reductase family protein [Sinomicrobium kalidii]UGU14730.1 AhpC/TSA family protein [Sinomicrobium kalidii]
MKQLFIMAISIALCWGCAQKASEKNNKARVSANIEGLEDMEIFISYRQKGDRKTDTIQVRDGQFTWEAEMPEPQKVSIMFPNRYSGFFAEKGNIQISGKADALHKLDVTGSELQAEADKYYETLKDLTDRESVIFGQYRDAGDEEKRNLEKRLGDIRSEKRKRGKVYIEKHPESIFSLNLVSDRATMGAYEEIKPLYDLLDNSVLGSDMGKRLTERLEVLKRSAIGETILDFTQNDVEGNPVSYADFRGQYVFIDFWASWCGPCRAENPNVLKAYNEYKDKNFTVLGVSLDDDEARWKKAIEEDSLPWVQVSDLKGFDNVISGYYGIRGIPSTLLVDPEGKIIAKDLRGDELHQKLAEVLP